MSMRKAGKALSLAIALGVATEWAYGRAEGPQLGRTLSPQEIDSIGINVFPDGSGLPPGGGTAAQGQAVYEGKCASCHGPKGLGGSAEELAGGQHSLTSDAPDKTVGIYWPYATTIFDFVRRSMPLDAPRSLSDDEVYAVTAYLLFLNGIIDRDREMNAQSLPKLEMPNRHGFISIFELEQTR